MRGFPATITWVGDAQEEECIIPGFLALYAENKKNKKVFSFSPMFAVRFFLQVVSRVLTSNLTENRASGDGRSEFGLDSFYSFFVSTTNKKKEKFYSSAIGG
jgi:hypothetical protein